MKNWLYIPFLLLMAVTYTRLAENFDSEEILNAPSRGPASLSVEEDRVECIVFAKQFNPHYSSENCL